MKLTVFISLVIIVSNIGSDSRTDNLGLLVAMFVALIIRIIAGSFVELCNMHICF